jgi:uncharacterized protein
VDKTKIAAMTAPFGPYRILSLSGGGFKGLYTAQVLAGLEKCLGRPLHECFDLVAGTSIGGILAIGVALGVPADVLAAAMEVHGPKIFGTDPPPSTRFGTMKALARNVRQAKYDATNLATAVEVIVGGKTSWKDLKTGLLVPAVGLISGSPQIFGSYAVPIDLKTIPLAKIALATAAAPTYFPTALVGKRSYVDGGLLANAPELLALVEAEKEIGIARERIHIAAIGTTHTTDGEAIVNIEARGLAGWSFGKKIIDLVLAGQERMTRDLVRKILENRYWVSDRPLSHAQNSQLALDCASPQAASLLTALASETIDSFNIPTWLISMRKRSAPN